jgi:DNA-binding SARP family transcriptional activator
MRYCILGPLWIDNDLKLSEGRREARILAALLLSANRAVSIDGLVDLLWPTLPPATAHKQARNCAASLDRLLVASGAAGLRRVPNGYLLRVKPAELDALQFEHAVEQARAARARADQAAALDLLRSALDLWRGDVLSGMALGRFEPLARRLAELRRTALAEYFAGQGDPAVEAHPRPVMFAGAQPYHLSTVD